MSTMKIIIGSNVFQYCIAISKYNKFMIRYTKVFTFHSDMEVSLSSQANDSLRMLSCTSIGTNEVNTDHFSHKLWYQDI